MGVEGGLKGWGVMHITEGAFEKPLFCGIKRIDMLKRPILIAATAVGALLILSFVKFDGNAGAEQQREPWSERQLMAPADLARAIERGGPERVYIYDIGPAGQIKGAEHIGEGRNPQNVEKLRAAVKDLPKDADIVLYCGCCPFVDCPNIRPTFGLLNDMGFGNHKLLDIEDNLKVDWIDRGFPME